MFWWKRRRLRSQLASGDSDERRAAADALGEVKDRRAVKLLVAALRDNSRSVRRAAAQALSAIGWEAPERGQRIWYAVALGDWEGAAQEGPAAVAPLVEALGTFPVSYFYCDPFADRLMPPDEVAAALVRIGPAAVDPLVETLHSEIMELQKTFVISVLGEIGDASAVDPLVEALDKHVFVATKALCKIGDRRAVEPLIRALRDKDNKKVRGTLAAALGKIKDPRALEALTEALKDRDSDLRYCAARALGQLGDSRATPALLAALSDEDGHVREGSAEALEALGWQPSDADQRGTRAVARKQWDEAVKEGAGALGPLLIALQSKNDLESRESAKALGALGDARAVGPLLEILATKGQGSVGDIAYEALVQLGSVAAEPLVEALEDAMKPAADVPLDPPISPSNKPHPDDAALAAFRTLSAATIRNTLEEAYKGAVRTAATRVLKAIGWRSSDANERAMYAVASEDWEAAAREGAAAVEPLATALRGWGSGAQTGAASALGRIKDTRAVEPLRAALNLYYAHAVLGNIVAEALQRIGWQPADADQRACYAVAMQDWRGAIGEGPAAVDPLISVLRNGNLTTQLEAARALGEVGQTRAAEPLLTALRDRQTGKWTNLYALEEMAKGAGWVNPNSVMVNAYHLNGNLEDFIIYKQDDVREAMDEEDLRKVVAEALGKIASPQEVGRIVAALQSGHWLMSAAQLLHILQQILECSSKSIQSKDLCAITALDNEVGELNFYWYHPIERQPERRGDIYSVDCTLVKDLAQQELTVRNELPPSRRARGLE